MSRSWVHLDSSPPTLFCKLCSMDFHSLFHNQLTSLVPSRDISCYLILSRTISCHFNFFDGYLHLGAPCLSSVASAKTRSPTTGSPVPQTPDACIRMLHVGRQLRSRIIGDQPYVSDANRCDVRGNCAEYVARANVEQPLHHFNQRYCNLIEHPWAKFASAPYLYGLFGSIWYHLFTQRGDAFVLFSDAIKHVQCISGQIPEKLCLNLLSTPTRKSLSLLVIHKKGFPLLRFNVFVGCRVYPEQGNGKTEDMSRCKTFIIWAFWTLWAILGVFLESCWGGGSTGRQNGEIARCYGRFWVE